LGLRGEIWASIGERRLKKGTTSVGRGERADGGGLKGNRLRRGREGAIFRIAEVEESEERLQLHLEKKGSYLLFRGRGEVGGRRGERSSLYLLELEGGGGRKEPPFSTFPFLRGRKWVQKEGNSRHHRGGEEGVQVFKYIFKNSPLIF
jgi:hypothetical protein